MSLTLIIGEKSYSSWSLRAWLMLKHLGVPFEETTIPLYTPGSRDAVRVLGGQTGQVPVLADGDVVIWDTLAILEYLHESYPAVWPGDRAARARARSLAAEMHSSFSAVRDAMPMNFRGRNRLARIDAVVQADIDRVDAIFASAPPDGWLCGEFSAVDAMMAPMACRLHTYGVPLSAKADAYAGKLRAHPLVQTWLGLGAAETRVIPQSELPERPQTAP